MGMQKKTLFLLVILAIPVVLSASIYFVLWFFLGRYPWGVPTEVGQLRDQKTYSVGNYRVRLNLHDHAAPLKFLESANSPKDLWIWCQTEKTGVLKLADQITEYQKKAAFTETGWRRFWVEDTNIATIPDALINKIFHEVNEEIAFTDSWLSTAITFDSCETMVAVSHFKYFSGQWSQNPPKGDHVRPPFFKKFIPTPDNTGGCFDVEPLYLQDRSRLRQLCTTDKGKTWAEPVGASAPAQQKPPESTKS